MPLIGLQVLLVEDEHLPHVQTKANQAIDALVANGAKIIDIEHCSSITTMGNGNIVTHYSAMIKYK